MTGLWPWVLQPFGRDLHRQKGNRVEDDSDFDSEVVVEEAVLLQLGIRG